MRDERLEVGSKHSKGRPRWRLPEMGPLMGDMELSYVDDRGETCELVLLIWVVKPMGVDDVDRVREVS